MRKRSREIGFWRHRRRCNFESRSWSRRRPPLSEAARTPCSQTSRVAPSEGFEPSHPAPEAGALSPELRGREQADHRSPNPLGLLPSTLYGVPDAKVLLVDDDPVILKLLQVNFEMEGYTVMTASDGVEGLEKARAERPDIVLLDIMMPRMDGLQVTKELKGSDDTKEIPIILLSAKAQASDVQTGRDVGADDYLTKPFDPLELLDRVGDLLGIGDIH
jgi:CheY-like chemotaxis protein